MAQANGIRQTTRNDHISPTFQQLLQRDGSKWSRISSEIKKNEDNGNGHSKKSSVLAKVKDKAKKWKISLRRKKHNDTNESRSSGVSLKDKEEEDVEYYSARSNVSSYLSSIGVSEYPQKGSRFSGMVSTLESRESKCNKNDEDGENIKGEAHTPDKGVVSVKEYLMHKFESGEDERALSKVITQAISPRRDKAREAMSSLLKNEESFEVNTSNVDKHVNIEFKSKSLPTSTNLNTNTGLKATTIKQSYSLGSNASKASMNLNQTFKSTFASYQNHFLGSSSKNNMTLNYSGTSSSTNTNPVTNQCLGHLNSPAKTSSSTLGHTSNANYETQTPSKGVVSSDKKTRVHAHKATSVRRVPVSRANQKRVPVHTETNTANSVSCI